MNKFSFAAAGLLFFSNHALAWNTEIPSGTTVTGGEVRYGEIQSVYGTSQNQTVSGTQRVKADGLSENATVYTYALQNVESGGRAVNAHILMQGEQNVSGLAENTTVDKYGRMYVRNGGTATGTVVNGGTMNVYAGGKIENTTLNGGSQLLYGTAVGSSLTNGARQEIRDSGTAENTLISDGAVQTVNDGASATGTTIDGGRQYVFGTATDTTLNSGDLYAYSGSRLTNTVINNGFMDITQSEIDGLTVNGGTVTAYENAQISGLKLYGGTAELYSGAVLNGSAVVNNASLTLNDSQTLDNLDMDNGTVNMTYDGTSKQFTVQNLNGSGNFYLTSALSENQLDHLEVASGSGNFGLHLHDYSREGNLPDKINLVNTSDLDEQFYLIGGAVDIGAYQYNLEHLGNEWYLQRSFNQTESSIIAKNTFSTLSTIFYTHLSSLNQRLGEVRFNHDNGLWIRGFGRNIKTSHKDDSSTKINIRGTQFGYDHLLPQSLVSKWLIGAYAGFSDTTDKFSMQGRADLDSYSTGLYTTLFSSGGYYIDLVGSYYHSRQKLTSYTPAGMPVKGKYNMDAWSVSAEGGRRIDFARGYFIEPQIQLSYMDLGDISYRTNFNTLVKGSQFNVLTGRIGLMAGKRFTPQFEGFIRTDLIHDFDNKSTVDVADFTFKEDISSTRWRIGAGFAAGFSETAAGYFNIATTIDDRIKVPLDINLGLRYEF